MHYPEGISFTVSLWRDHLLSAYRECDTPAMLDEARCVRRALGVLEEAPKTLRNQFGVFEASDAIEAVLQARGFDAAAVILLGKESRYMISRGPSGNGFATVILRATETEISEDRENVALAIVAALLRAVIHAIDDTSETSMTVPNHQSQFQ